MCPGRMSLLIFYSKSICISRVFEEEYSDALLQEFANNLKNKLPGFDWFENAFMNVGWSDNYDLYRGEKNKNRVQIILEVIEKFMAQSHKAHEFTIEHIITLQPYVNMVSYRKKEKAGNHERFVKLL